MASFANPFSGMIPERKLTKDELIRALREMVSTEMEATNLYQALADSIEDENIAKVLRDVADEEIVHVGEFQKLLYDLAPEEKKFVDKGIEEASSKTKQDSEEKKTLRKLKLV